MARPLTAVSLYSGAGGLDYGFEAAGFQTRVGIDFDQDSCLTLRANRSWPVLYEDIHNVTGEALLKISKLKRSKVDILFGGPPCQPFSKSSYWVSGDSRRLDDPRASTLHAYMRCVEELLPAVFVLENVHGISYSGKEEGFRLLYSMTGEINNRAKTHYTLAWRVLNSADYGVPQMRSRFFLVGHRDGDRFQFPRPTHFPAPDFSTADPSLWTTATQSYATAWDAIGGFEPPPDEDLKAKGYWGDLLPSIPEGENYLWHTNRKGGENLFGWRTRYWSFLLKLAKARPSWTLQAQPGPAIGPFHWNNRRLSMEEMARLQTFPRNLSFVGGRVSVQRQLGNAVPSLLAEVLGREIARQFFSRETTEPPRLLVCPRSDMPGPEPVLPVPEKYLVHRGDHPDHPGEGRGNRVSGSVVTA